jgi:hypothetical protein
MINFDEEWHQISDNNDFMIKISMKIEREDIYKEESKWSQKVSDSRRFYKMIWIT